MIREIGTGLACGLATAGVSEAVLRIVPDIVEHSLFRALAVGAVLRAIWVLALMAWALTAASVDVRFFIPTLLLGYLASQVFEGIRYTRYFERC